MSGPTSSQTEDDLDSYPAPDGVSRISNFKHKLPPYNNMSTEFITVTEDPGEEENCSVNPADLSNGIKSKFSDRHY